jgi:MFS transporter, FSR family, fosmidomycin resistance protein
LDKKSINLQRAQLAVLALTHFQADMFGNFLPPILPVLRERFTLSLVAGTVIMVVFYFVHNGIQVIIGHTRVNKDKPLLLQVGLVLSAMVCLLTFLQNWPGVYPLLLLLVVISGCGIGMAHNEGLRSVHTLSSLSPSLSTSIFMTGGYLGAAMGQLFAALFVARFGLKGLLILMPLPLVVVSLVYAAKLRLAVDGEGEDVKDYKDAKNERYHFWYVVVMTVPASIATFIIFWFVPTRLNELGFPLTFGGLSSMVFTFASTAGSFLWGMIAHKVRQMYCAIIALLIGVPAIFFYLYWMCSAWAVILLAIAGFCSTGAYIMFVTMARSAIGLKIGQRVGILVGGTWAVAGVFVLAGVEFMNLGTLLYLAPVCYLVSVGIGLYILRKSKTAVIR